ncbi:MAG: hypothetical protein H8E94_02105 [Alphaproteobacteria bacterium]|nr:hypothetical protein [Alphaproteobacteria bacterium]
MVNYVMVEKAARELFERHGKLAVEIAFERAERLSRRGDQPTLGRALLVLNEVEKLVGKTGPSQNLRYSRLH